MGQCPAESCSRRPITPETRNVMFAVYAPAGIQKMMVMQHLADIQRYVLMVSPQAGHFFVSPQAVSGRVAGVSLSRAGACTHP